MQEQIAITKILSRLDFLLFPEGWHWISEKRFILKWAGYLMIIWSLRWSDWAVLLISVLVLWGVCVLLRYKGGWISEIERYPTVTSHQSVPPGLWVTASVLTNCWPWTLVANWLTPGVANVTHHDPGASLIPPFWPGNCPTIIIQFISTTPI